MSYADVAAHNAPPPADQPKPDPALLQTEPPTASNVIDDAAKINLAAPDFKDHPATVTSEADVYVEVTDDEDNGNVNGSEKRKKRVKKRIAEAEAGAADIWAIAQEKLFQPSVAGGLLGVVNVGILGYCSYALYATPELRRDTKILTIGSLSVAALLGAEGFAAERYAQTPRGQAERKRAKKEGAAIYRRTREVVLRPGVLGGIVGLVNVGILGGVGYAAYTHWDAPRWDRSVVSAVSIGLLGLWSGEGILAEKYSETRKQ